MPMPKSKIIRLLKKFITTRGGTATLGAVGGFGIGYQAHKRLEGVIPSLFMPEGYRVVPRMRVVRDPNDFEISQPAPRRRRF